MTDQRPSDRVFAGSIPELYERIMVPMIFEPYAQDLARRAATVLEASASATTALLEVAAGTGAVTRELAARLPATATITASDLNQPMLDVATGRGTARPITWQLADVMSLPFPDGSFDAVVCQFGVMFFPDRPGGYAEIRRVLRPGGTFLFNVWGGLEDNDFARVVTEALDELFPDDPSTFMARVPHGYHDPQRIQADLVAAGFTSPASFVTIDERSRCASAAMAATGYTQGTPAHNEILSRDPGAMGEATARAAAAIERCYGATDIDAKISATVVSVTSP